jgi:hypothetical protein
VIPITQGIEIYGLNFHVFRLILLAGWINIAFRNNLKLGEMTKTDKAIVYWVIISFVVYIIQQNHFDAVINRLGFAYNAIGIYFLYRIIIKRTEDITTLFNTLTIILAIIAIAMLNEQMTGKNIFNVFGIHGYSDIRMGMVRSQGPFSHSINAGMFGATMLPLCFSMWRHKWGSAFLGIIGTISACVLVITSASMTPIVTCISGIVGLMFWPFRNNMRMVKYCGIFAVVVLQIIIMTPLWNLITKFDFIKGANALHRFTLVDNLINRINEWFLLGSSAHEYWAIGTQDAANQYYSEAVSGGIVKLALFIIIIILSFNIIGRKLKHLVDIPSQKRMWALGSALFANVVGFFGISYWDQMLIVWYLLLALITSTSLINVKEGIGVDEMPINMEKTKNTLAVPT